MINPTAQASIPTRTTASGLAMSDLQPLLEQRAWLRSLARTLVRDEADADDLVQNTWLRALQRGAAVASPRAWLGTVLRNERRQQRRAEGRRAQHEQQLEVRDDAPSTAEVHDRFETGLRIAEAVQSLDEPFRSTVLLHFFEGMSLASIARREQTPAGTVRWRLHEALRRLRALLEQKLGKDTWRGALLAVAQLGAIRRTAAIAWMAALLFVAVGAWFTHRALTDSVTPAPTVQESANQTGSRTPNASPAIAGGPLDRTEPDQDSPPANATRPRPSNGPVFSPASADMATVRARILDQEGQPIAGAKLGLTRVAFGNFMISDSLMQVWVPSARSDDSGAVALSLRAPKAVLDRIPDNFRPGRDGSWKLELKLSAAGHAATVRQVVVHDGDDLDVGDLQLMRAASVRGRVVDANGNGLNGAKVTLSFGAFARRSLTTRARNSKRPDQSTTTSGFFTRGQFAFDDVPIGVCRIRVSQNGYETVRRLIDVQAGGDALEPIPLRSSGSAPSLPTEWAEVIVRTPDGKPAPAAFVHVFQSRGRYHGASCDRNGKASFAWQPGQTSRWSLIAVTHHEAEGGPRMALATDVDPASGRIVLLLDTAARHQVTVRDGTGAALADAWIGYDFDSDGDLEIFQKTGADGRALLLPPPALATRSVELVAKREGFRTLRLPCAPTNALPDELTLQLMAGWHGRVVDAAGEPLADAKVLLVRADRHTQAQGARAEYYGKGNWTTRTDRDGAFSVFPDQDQDANVHCRLYIRAEQHAPLLTEDLPLGRDAGTLRMARGGSLTGTLRTRDGTTLARRTVALNDFLGRLHTATTDERGRYAFENLRAADYQLLLLDRETDVSSWGYSSLDEDAGAQTVGTDLRIRDGEATAHDFVLDRCTLRLHVRGDNLADLRAGTAELTRSFDRSGVACDRGGHDGTFELHSHAPGPHLLRISARGRDGSKLYVEAHVDLVAGTTEHTIAFATSTATVPLPQLPHPGEVHVRVDHEWFTAGAFAYVRRGDATAALAIAPVGTARLTLEGHAGKASLGKTNVLPKPR